MSNDEWARLCDEIESLNGIEFPRPCDSERLQKLLDIQNDELRLRMQQVPA